MEAEVLIFGGTVEGRLLCDYVKSLKKRAVLYVATEYGESLIAEDACLKVLTGRLGKEEMKEQFCFYKPRLILDATHPYAKEVTKNIAQACKETGFSYIRVRREEEQEPKQVLWVNSIEEAVSYVAKKKGNVLVTTGSKEIEAFLAMDNYEERLFARILPSYEMVKKCTELGIRGRNLICMQGPFSEEMNLAMIKEFQISFLITKESGARGGFGEKVRAGEKAGIRVIGIRRPKEEAGCCLEEAKQKLACL